jgi:hypothetical protein
MQDGIRNNAIYILLNLTTLNNLTECKICQNNFLTIKNYYFRK